MRPILEYRSLQWNLHSQHEIDMIEHIISHFLKYAITNLSVSVPPTLELRRVCQVLQLYYSILNNSCRIKPDKFLLINNRQNLRGHQLTLKIPMISTSAYQNFFNIRYLNLWNSLSPEAVFYQLFSLICSSHLYNELLL